MLLCPFVYWEVKSVEKRNAEDWNLIAWSKVTSSIYLGKDREFLPLLALLIRIVCRTFYGLIGPIQIINSEKLLVPIFAFLFLKLLKESRRLRRLRLLNCCSEISLLMIFIFAVDTALTLELYFLAKDYLHYIKMPWQLTNNKLNLP